MDDEAIADALSVEEAVDAVDAEAPLAVCSATNSAWRSSASFETSLGGGGGGGAPPLAGATPAAADREDAVLTDEAELVEDVAASCSACSRSQLAEPPEL